MTKISLSAAAVATSAFIVLALTTDTISATITTFDAPAASAAAAARTTPPFLSNKSYKLTATLQINRGSGGGGAGAGGTAAGGTTYNNNNNNDDNNIETVSMPLDVITLYNPETDTYRQRISYFHGLVVSLNNNGTFHDRFHKNGGTDYGCVTYNSTTDEDDHLTNGILHFFPLLDDFHERYVIDPYTKNGGGGIVRDEPGLPFVRATKKGASSSSRMAAAALNKLLTSTDQHETGTVDQFPNNDHPAWKLYNLREEEEEEEGVGVGRGTPDHDTYEFQYTTIGPMDHHHQPKKWIMNARNEIFSSHTEGWIVDYRSYTPIETDEELRYEWQLLDEHHLPRECQNNKTAASSSSEEDATTFANREKGRYHRLGMIFPKVSPRRPSQPDTSNHDDDDDDEGQFDLVGTILSDIHGKTYSTPVEGNNRKLIATRNMHKIVSLQEEHGDRASFLPNEYIDWEVDEFLVYRGGLARKRRSMKAAEGDGIGGESTNLKKKDVSSASLRASGDVEMTVFVDPREQDEGEDIEGDSGELTFPTYRAPSNFDPRSFPPSFDWRTHHPGSVGPIKDQGICGSCWAFSTIGAIESHWFIHNRNDTVLLPEQYVVDCTWDEYNSACDGGFQKYGAGEIIRKYGGIVPVQSSYGSYLSVDGRCYMDTIDVAWDATAPTTMGVGAAPWTDQDRKREAVKITDWMVIEPRDQLGVQHALYTRGPLAVSINVVPALVYYDRGVVDTKDCTKNTGDDLDHAVVLVGWDVEEETGKPYWILRNSWSTLWGDDGYFRIVMGERDCGITSEAGFPVVAQVVDATDAEQM